MLSLGWGYCRQPADNNRYEELTFTCPEAAVLHGFVGYFETQLYDDVWLSTSGPREVRER